METTNQDKIPLISIIVPIYNTAEYLPRCIDSILNQTHGNLEIILINDGSTDGSGEICDEYAAKDRHIKVIHQKNSGVSAARNAGLDAVQGEWFGFVDSDDYIEHQMYEKLLAAALAHNKKLACCGHTVHKLDGTKLIKVSSSTPSELSQLDVLKHFFMEQRKIIHLSLWGKLYHRSFIGESDGLRFDPTIHCVEDYLFLTQIVLKCDGLAYVPELLYNYVKHASSITGQGINEKYMTGIIAHKRIVKMVEPISRSLRQSVRLFYTKTMYRWLRMACKSKEAYKFIPTLQKESGRYTTLYLLSRNVSAKDKTKYLKYLTFPKVMYKLTNKNKTPTSSI